MIALLPLLLLAAAKPLTVRGCIDIAGEEGGLMLEGQLEAHVYPGPPDYQDVRRGDSREDAYILVLDRSICIEDDDDLADPSVRFDRVHLYTTTDANWPRLRDGVGRRVHVRGTGFAAQTGHDRAPLVVDVNEIRVEGR
jgi:uncharacterized protein DUF4431